VKKLMGLSVLFCVAALGAPKTESKPEAGSGHIPSHGPAPAKAIKPVPAGANDISEDKADHPQVLHVDAKNDRWVGHVTGPSDPHYKLAQPWANGHFTGGSGPLHVFTLAGGGPERFWFGKFYWPVASDDYNLVADWNWVSGLAYNPRLGTYAQVEYLG
jgi:hypothetical protein